MVEVRLGEVQETLLATLYARAVETRKRRGLLRDPMAVAMVEAIDYDFVRFDGSPMLYGSVLRTLIFDHWVTAARPGTVIEIGAGLNTRFERVDNGELHWIDLDLHDSMDLRRRFFTESPRHRLVAGSILDGSWVAAVKALPEPYFFVAEGVLLYFDAERARQAIAGIARHFPGAHLAFDTANSALVAEQDRPALRKDLDVRFQWACDDPRRLEQWSPGLRLVESRTLLDLPPTVAARLPLTHRLLLPAIRLAYGRRAEVLRVNLFQS